MNAEAQRIAIAQACGWRAKEWSSGSWYVYDPEGKRHSDPSTGTRESAFVMHAPDYLSDLNAMAEAEATLTTARLRWTYVMNLNDSHVTPHGNILLETDYVEERAQEAFPVVTATAAQRAEAFLKTIAQWRSEPSPSLSSPSATGRTEGK